MGDSDGSIMRVGCNNTLKIKSRKRYRMITAFIVPLIEVALDISILTLHSALCNLITARHERIITRYICST